MDTNAAAIILRRLKAQVEVASVELIEADPDFQLSDTGSGIESLLDGISTDLIRLEDDEGIFE